MFKRKSTYSVISVFMAVLMIVLSVVSPVGALSETLTTEEATLKPSVSPADKIDSVLKEKMAEASPDEKIPVAIWYEDIDQEQVDTLTTQKVGFSREEVALDYEMPSTALLNDLKEEKDGADAELEAYMERTKLQRESERKRTDDYIMTRREFSREKYNEKSANIVKDLSLNESDITFNSQYAPMIIAELTVNKIGLLSEDQRILDINYYEERELEECSLESATNTMTVNKINMDSLLGLSGDGIKVAIIENNAVRLSQYEETGRYIVPDSITPVIRTAPNGAVLKDYGNVVVVGDTIESNQSTHADAVANTLLTVSPNIKLYSSNFSFKNIEAFISDGVHMISRSTSVPVYEDDENYAYSDVDKWSDHIVSMHNVTILMAAGNTGKELKDSTYDEKGEIKIKRGPRVVSPGMGYNVITVGAYSDVDDSGQVVNTLCKYSSYQNSLVKDDGTILSGCEKPDIVAPASFNGEGTSNSTPFVAGMVALVLELKPALISFPQAIKAIVLASCHRKATHLENSGVQESIWDGITDRQGAGIPDAFTMASIVSQGTYGVGRISATATQGIRRFVMPSQSSSVPSTINISVTWLKENYFKDAESHENYNVSEKNNVNLNLYVYRNGEYIEKSELANSSTEMVYLQLDENNWNYEIRINKAEVFNDVVRYGYAYSTNKPYVEPITDKGIYYIRNYVTDKYLTLNSNNEAVMENFTGATNQQWVISGEPDDYDILPAYGELGKEINYGAQVGSNPYYKAVLGTYDINFSINSWETDTTLEPDAHTFTSSSEGRNNILSYTSSTGIFVRSTTEPVVNMYRMWVLEDINYRVGDADMNGVLNIEDSTYIQKLLASENGINSLNNIEFYLADTNRDGRITILDSTAIGKIIANIIYY